MSEGHDFLDAGEVDVLASRFDAKPPQALIAWALARWDSRVALATSFQAESMVILDMAWRMRRDVRVFTIDTGRLPQETYDIMERVRARYNIEIEVFCPDATQVEAMVRAHGPNLFYSSIAARQLCCQTRKVAPLHRALHGLDAWMTGLRRDQGSSRARIRKIAIDHDHGGLAKLNPLADLTDEQVWHYIRTHDVPSHPLYRQGYTSIGCAPCTRPTHESDPQRAGRWWWEQNGVKECGLHGATSAGEQAWP
jgi:phosphoadenosine phosphosulfate reductase